MHVLLIHQAFASHAEAGGTRHYELARYLADQGIHVSIVAGEVNYLSAERVDTRKQTHPTQLRDGIALYHSWTYDRIHHSFFARLLSFFSFAFSSFITALRIRDVDIVWGTTPPIFQCVTAYLTARVKRVPFVLEVRDLWPDFAVALGVVKNPLIIRASRWLERFLYHHADLILINSPGFYEHLEACGVPGTRIELVPNGVDVSMFDLIETGKKTRQELGLDGEFVVLYAGAHGVANGLETVLDAAKRLENHPEIVWLFVGDGKERPNLVRKAEEMRLSNVRFVPSQPKAAMPSLIAASDVCLAILRPTPLFKTTYPNKVFDYMAGSRPTVLAIDGVIREVIERAGAGIYVEPGDPEALAQAVLKYYGDPDLRQTHGQNGRAHVETHFNRQDIAKQAQAVFEGLASTSRKAKDA